jgi:mannose-6-phosphate isomerase-like protein (cupin superfamily)
MVQATRYIFLTFISILFLHAEGSAQAPDSTAGYIVRRDSAVVRHMPSPHDGKGISSGFLYFDDVPDFDISFRKRILPPGSSIGKHRQTEDEVYYVLRGHGIMNINETQIPLKPGDAVLTRTGSIHETIQQGDSDLVLIIVYKKHG